MAEIDPFDGGPTNPPFDPIHRIEELTAQLARAQELNALYEAQITDMTKDLLRLEAAAAVATRKRHRVDL